MIEAVNSFFNIFREGYEKFYQTHNLIFNLMDIDQVFMLEGNFLSPLRLLDKAQISAKKLIKDLKRENLLVSIAKDFNLICFKIKTIVDLDLEKMLVGAKDLKVYCETFAEINDIIEAIWNQVEMDNPYELQIIEQIGKFEINYKELERLKDPILTNLGGLRVIFENINLEDFEQSYEFVRMHSEVFYWFRSILENRKANGTRREDFFTGLNDTLKDKPEALREFGEKFLEKFQGK